VVGGNLRLRSAFCLVRARRNPWGMVMTRNTAPRIIFAALCLWAGLCLGSCGLGAPAFAATSMIASYYGAESGHRTASGERFRPEGLTAAHRTLPFGTRLRVCYRGACVVVRVTDRGPAKWTHRSLDLSKGAAQAIGMLRVGVARVTVEKL
jgi:hypothetical protein